MISIQLYLLQLFFQLNTLFFQLVHFVLYAFACFFHGIALFVIGGLVACTRIGRIVRAQEGNLFVQFLKVEIHLGAVVLRTPTMTDFDVDPLGVIETGDRVRIDADAGEVHVWKKAHEE